MSKITIIKIYKQIEGLRLITLQELADYIRTGKYHETVDKFRKFYPLFVGTSTDRYGNLDVDSEIVRALPRICFALEQSNRNRERVTKAYTGLVLLEVNNLTSRDEAEAVRRGAAEMPQTLMTFVGAEGLSVKIVCRGELFPDEGGGLPTDSQQIQDFHENLYERARLIYNGQLGVTVEKLEPLTARVCHMSSDPGIVYNPTATCIYARPEKPSQTTLRNTTSLEMTDGEKGYERYRNMHIAFEYNLSKAYDDTVSIADDEERRHATMSRLAQYCVETGLPMGVAMRQAMMHSRFWEEQDLGKKVFENTYSDMHMTQYMKKKGIQRTKNIPPETLMIMRVNIFLQSNYELRKNVMRGVAEYRFRTGIGFSFQDLTEEARNSITMRALEQGIRCWDKDIRRYVNSDDIEHYDPMNEFLENLPPWDGHDRVTALAQRVPTEYEAWSHLFHVWMRSMVAMWQGKGQLTGNALVPLLIGRQGCGKSSFCRILLPRDMREYYNDRINFKNEQDLNLGLTSFALINLDEFDKITQRQQIVLKYLVSTADLKYRPPYGKAYTANRRYASFIGTTNEQNPLVDPTGSRRFICVSIDGDIDFETPVQYDQLYAQLKHEIRKGERYWLDKDEERQLMEHNLQYQRLNGLGEMLMSLIQKPRPGENGIWMSLKDLSALIKQHFRNYQEDEGSFIKIGSYLQRPEYKFERKHSNTGMKYWVKIKI